LYGILAFISAFYLLYTKKVGSIAIVFIYGIFGLIFLR
jgi:chromate transporter